ncbi:hypothetical protein [Peribacillus sp. SCS-155]|uniref:hypothetical protein n=1 Tax=Peribacillus sedimenti TaxID=3115297 RepID=UPI003906285D
MQKDNENRHNDRNDSADGQEHGGIMKTVDQASNAFVNAVGDAFTDNEETKDKQK